MREGARSGSHASDLAAAWQASTLQRGILARLLWPASILYGTLFRLRRWLYAKGLLKTHRLPVPVIVVGNVVVGGAGKTPATVSLMRHLQAKGWRPGVVSRGYGREGQHMVEVNRQTLPDVCGDEPLLIHRTTQAPVFVSRRRADAGRALLAVHPEVNVLLCDDGLQHLALGRDIAIAVFDDRGMGNGWLLPAGLLREPWPPEANGPDLVLRQFREDADPAPADDPAGLPTFQAMRRLADHATNALGQVVGLERLRGQALHAVAGIARPEVFFDMLRSRGLTLAAETALPDHAAASDYRGPVESAQHPLVCTEKDAVKLFAVAQERGAGAQPVWAVPLELRPEPAFFAAVDALLAACPKVHTGSAAAPEHPPG